MFKATLTIGNAFDRLRSIPERAAEKFRDNIGASVSDELQGAVLDIMQSAVPGEPSSPFDFGSDQSSRFWFWLVEHNKSLTDGVHWIRTGDLEDAWKVEVSYSGFAGKITVFNTRPEANTVYGPDAVPGHERTGWPDKLRRARDLVNNQGRRIVFDTFDKAVYDAAKEAGF